ncbi:unnamed protein product [Brassica oleracea var. botrytis]
MDYERIGKTQVTSGGGGGLSPRKLRSMLLLGADRKKKEDMIEPTPIMRSGSNQSDDLVASGSDDCKDVDVVCEITTDYDNVSEEVKSVSASLFEFQKTEKDKAAQRLPTRSFSKPAPSKWDDAQKWIASPTSNRPKTAGQVHVSKKGPSFGRQSSMKILEVAAAEEPDTKRIDVSQVRKETGEKFVSWEVDSYVKPVLTVDNSIATEVNLSRHDSSIATAFAQPPSTARSVSMRDMGTEMTPIASQEPSRNGTPIRATTPIRSPITSEPSSPGRRQASSASQMSNKELSEKELQMKTRREIMELGTQLGKLNIAAWASKEDEDKDASTSLKNKAASLQTSKSVSEARASAWEEAEKAKHMARFRREEMKIQAWENHQKAKSEAEMRKTEVEVERIKGRAQDRLMNKLAEIERKAEGKRAAAEAKKIRQAAKTEKQAEQIRRTGKVPSLMFSCFSFCS